MRLRSALALSLVLVAEGTAPCARARADSAPSFRGVQFDVDLRKQMPECPRGAYDLYGRFPDRPCWMRLCSRPPCRDDKPFSVSLADRLNVYLEEGHVTQDDDKLVDLSFGFATRSFGDLEPILKAKYGQPAISTEEPWQSKGGVRTKAQLRIWIWNGLRIYLKAPGYEIDTGVLDVRLQKWHEHVEQRHKKQLKGAVEDL